MTRNRSFEWCFRGARMSADWALAAREQPDRQRRRASSSRRVWSSRSSDRVAGMMSRSSAGRCCCLFLLTLICRVVCAECVGCDVGDGGDCDLMHLGCDAGAMGVPLVES